jgi:hypothetical protein
MKYSQPFGTPEPPQGNYPRYINGNPVTGTEGSIPPATSIDEDQIELVTVIMNAKAGDIANDIPGDPTLGDPSHADLSQLWKSLMSLFAQRYITTHITKTVHGAGADFIDLNAALKWAAKFIITPSGLLTLRVTRGTWSYTSTVEINHPNSSRIEIVAELLPTQNVPQNYMSVTYTAGGNPGIRDTDGGNQYNQLIAIWKTELQFQNGVSGFRILTGGVRLAYLLLTGSQTQTTPVAGDPTGCGICALNSRVIIDQMAFSKWGFVGYYGVGAALVSYTSNSNVFSYCKTGGLWTYSGMIQFPTNQCVVTTSMGVAGWTHFGTEVYAGVLDCRGCTTPRTASGGAPTNNGAVQVEQGTQFMAPAGSLIRFNNHIGVTIPDASSCQMSGSTVMDNGTWQIWMNNGVCWAEGANLQQAAGTVFPNGGVATCQNGAQLSLIGALVGGSVVPTPNVYNTADNSFVRR